MAGNESYYVHDLEWFVDKSRNTDISTEHIRNTRDENPHQAREGVPVFIRLAHGFEIRGLD